MTYTVSITSQGQISIPAKIRRQLGLNNTKRVLVSTQDNKVIVEPIVDLLELKGSLKTNKKPLSDKKLDELIAQAVADDYAKKHIK